MKKTLLALAVLGTFAGAASAQSNVTVYGVVDAGIQYKNDGNPAGKKLGLDSGLQSGSRIGFKGTEDLGGGLSAIFTLENGFNIDDGTLGQSTKETTRLFGRQAWVGLAGGFGAVKFGRQQTALYNALNIIDPFGINLAGNAQKVFGYGLYAADPLARTDNTVSYSTANFNGFSASVSYGFGETAGNNSDKRNVGVGAQYANGPINVQFAYQDSNTVDFGLDAYKSVAKVYNSGKTDLKTAFIGGTYDFGVAKAHLAYGDTKLEQAGKSVKDRNWLVGVSAPVGAAGTVLASYVRNDVKDLDNAKSDQYALGYTHALSKRTNLYTSYSYMKNDNGVALNADSAAIGGASVRTFNVGMRHQF
jgi:predicted porin